MCDDWVAGMLLSEFLRDYVKPVSDVPCRRTTPAAAGAWFKHPPVRAAAFDPWVLPTVARHEVDIIC